MRWNRSNRVREREAADRFRAEHSAWLTLAQLTGRKYPQIPVRPADRGGFDRLRRRSGGLQRAAMWWRAALDRVNDIF